MDPGKIILFYKFTPLADADAIRLWQKTLCEALGLRGRILLSKDGINGTLGGPLSAVKKYIRAMKDFPAFRDVEYKWSEGKGHEFPRLQIRVRDEIVTFGVPHEIVVDDNGIVGGGEHLSPLQVNELVAQRGDEVVFFDGRNEYEARIGKFRNAIVPSVDTTPEFLKVLESGIYDHLKDRPIVTYCTGGIRCEVLSMLMKNRGFNEVYQLDGGVVRYGEKYKDTGLWEGSLYVFDHRFKIDFSKDAKVLGTCHICAQPTNEYHNCSDLTCRVRTLICPPCVSEIDEIFCAVCLPTAQ
ncbi:MAG: rhodanese-related sulfurtransferase [Actinobacteria bacterium]|nr:rhodanese-related sulfurtransferase [Actinomycetota bacterium]MTB11457.1 rhodanese-related sulfurtransferase [Actinomycetota bacterium]